VQEIAYREGVDRENLGGERGSVELFWGNNFRDFEELTRITGLQDYGITVLNNWFSII
jgi:hypothetical protein